MRIVLRLRRLLAGPPPAEPAGPAIQAHEQADAVTRLLTQARRMPSGWIHDYGRWTR